MPEDSKPAQSIRYRISYRKSDPARFTGHLDLQRIWDRMFRRGQVPIAFSQGFNPRPKINMSSALPLGFTSSCELLDVWLQEEVQVDTLLDILRQVSVPGIEIESISLPSVDEPNLQQMIDCARYEIRFSTPPDVNELERRCIELLEAQECIRSRRGKKYDLRPLIQQLHVDDNPVGQPKLKMTLSSGEGATGRPEEVLLELGYDPAEVRTHREAFVLKQLEC
jgi:radical SAM-linked protein